MAELAPSDTRLAELRRDYTAMEPMFLSPPSTFDDRIATRKEAEAMSTGGLTIRRQA